MSRSAIIKERLVNALRAMDMPPHKPFKVVRDLTPIIDAEMYRQLRRLSQEANIVIITAQQRRR